MNRISLWSSTRARLGLDKAPAPAPRQPVPPDAQDPHEASLALITFRRLEGTGGRLQTETGEAITAEEAVVRLSAGQSVMVRVVPPRGPARSTSSLLLCLEDAAELPRLMA